MEILNVTKEVRRQNTQTNIANHKDFLAITTYTPVVNATKVAKKDARSINTETSNTVREPLIFPLLTTHRSKNRTSIELHIAKVLNKLKTLKAQCIISSGYPSPSNPPGTWNAAARVMIVSRPATMERAFADSFVSSLRMT